MSGHGCTEACGFCGACTLASDADGFMETCSHPAHWRDERGCRLCGAHNTTLTRQEAQRRLADEARRAEILKGAYTQERQAQAQIGAEKPRVRRQG